MIPASLSLLAFLLETQNPAPRAEERKALFDQGMVLVTGDAALEKRARREFYFTAEEQFAKLFPTDRFDIVPWKEKRWLVIDRTTGPLGEIADGILLAKGLLAKCDNTRTLDVAALSPEEYRAARAVFGNWPDDPTTRKPSEPSALGLDSGYTVSLTSGGRTRKFSIDLPNAAHDAMYAGLRGRVLGSHRTSPGDLQAGARTLQPTPHDQSDFIYLVPPRERSEATVRAAEAIRLIEVRMTRAAQEAGDNLLKKLGSSPRDASLADSSNMSQMPSDIRNALSHDLSEGWQSFGFANKEDALGFLDAANSFGIQTNLRLFLIVDPSAPSIGRPGWGLSYPFQSVPGMFRPGS